jgi:hypothetical protein
MPRWIQWLLHHVGLATAAAPDRRIAELDGRSRAAIGRAAERLNDDDLRRLAALDVAVRIHRRSHRGAPR